MSRIVLVIGAVVVVSLAGCVSQRTHDMKVAELESQIQATRSSVTSGAEKLGASQAENQDLQLKLQKALASAKELEKLVAAAKKEAMDYKAKYEKVGGALVDRLRSIPGVVVSKAGGVQATVSFALGGDALGAKAAQDLQALAKGLAGNKGPIYVDGHSDNSPVGSLEARKKYTDNLGLSVARAAAVARVLVKAGIPAKSLVVRGWGSEQPVASNDARAGRAKNRRVEITFDPAQTPKPEEGEAKEPEADAKK